MLNNLNLKLFNLLNVTYNSPLWIISLSKFSANYLINIIPILLIFLWIKGLYEEINVQHRLVIKVIQALFFSLAISWILRQFLPFNRPFVDNVGCNLLHHVADYSFPSKHGTVIFTFALAFLFWHRIWSGMLLMIVAFTVAWSRVYLGVHWPLDMLGSLLVGVISCLGIQVLWKFFDYI